MIQPADETWEKPIFLRVFQTTDFQIELFFGFISNSFLVGGVGTS